jgi:hypothetical protein
MNEAKWFEDDEPMIPVFTPHGSLIDLVRAFPHYKSGCMDAVVSCIHQHEVEIVTGYSYFAPTFDCVATWILGTGERVTAMVETRPKRIPQIGDTHP